jgi:hypothetical protein
MRDARLLAAASRALSQREREQKAAAKRATEATPPPSGVEVVAAMKQSRDARTKLLEEIQRRLARISASGTRGDLDRLAGALSLYELRIERRETKL